MARKGINWKLRLRILHRWLGPIVGVQLFFWTISGFYFSWHKIEEVRGEDLMTEPETISPGEVDLASPEKALANLKSLHPEIEVIEKFALRSLLGKPVYEIAYLSEGGEIQFALADARTGNLRLPLNQKEAVALARSGFQPEAAVRQVDFVEKDEAGSEYRGRPLPAYRISFEHPSNMRYYVSVNPGRITARRNGTWRIFDFLWMLHTMDYQERDNFNNLLLKTFSILGITTILSGFLLWGVTVKGPFPRLKSSSQ